MVIALTFLAGIFSFASFAPIGAWWLAPVSIALLLRALSEKKIRSRALIVLMYGLIFFGPLLSWSNTYVGDLPWLLLVLLESSLLFPLALIPFSRARPFLYILFPSALLLAEGIESRFPFGGFGWGRLAFAQANAPYATIAWWGGAPAVSFMVGSIAVLLIFVWNRNVKYLFCLLILVLVCAPLFAPHNAKSIGRTSIVAIQGGVPSMGLEFNARAQAVFRMHVNATQDYLSKASTRPNIILWPENAIDVDPFLNPTINEEILAIVNKWNVSIIAGAVLENGDHFANASILWQPKVGVTTIYRKQHLTPFGEYIPLRPISEFLSSDASHVTNFLPGHEIVVHSVGKARIGPIICFEVIDDALGAAVSKRSNLLVIQTNSATFGTSAQSRQQLGITQIRAIEHGRFIVSAATTGISAIVDNHGKVMQSTKIGKIGALKSQVELISAVSFSDRYGQKVEALLIVIPITILLLCLLVRRRSAPQFRV